jgi:arylmalonate decarboxylase
MTISRRQLLAATTTTALGGLLPHVAMAAEKRRLGLIFPVIDRGQPEEGLTLYGDSIDYLINNLDLKTMTPDGYDAVIDQIPEKALGLAAQGVEAIMIMGTSLTFYQGREFNERLARTVAEATGLPTSTMSNGIINGLKEVGGKNIVCATAYNDEVNNRLVRFLGEHDFNVLNIEGLGIEAVEDIFSVTDPQLIEFCEKVTNDANAADAILISCGGLITLNILAPVEERVRIPAVSSTPHALFEGTKLLGMDPHVQGYGQLISG